jgi:hypothetical protein
MGPQPYFEEEPELTKDQVKEMEQQKKTIDSIIVGTFQTPLGKKCLEHFEEVFVNRDVYLPGMSFEETTHRAGEARVIRKIRNTLEGALNGR